MSGNAYTDASGAISSCITPATVQWFRSAWHPRLYHVLVGVGCHQTGTRFVAGFHAVVDDFGTLVEVRP